MPQPTDPAYWLTLLQPEIGGILQSAQQRIDREASTIPRTGLTVGLFPTARSILHEAGEILGDYAAEHLRDIGQREAGNLTSVAAASMAVITEAIILLCDIVEHSCRRNAAIVSLAEEIQGSGERQAMFRRGLIWNDAGDLTTVGLEAKARASARIERAVLIASTNPASGIPVEAPTAGERKRRGRKRASD